MAYFDSLLLSIFCTLVLAKVYECKKTSCFTTINTTTQNPSTSTEIIIAIVMGWVGLDFMVLCFSEMYKDLPWFFFTGICGILGLWFVGSVLAPKLAKFLGSSSTASAMQVIYNSKIRTIVAFVSMAQCLGVLALQLYMLAIIFSNFYAIPYKYSITMSAIIMLAYGIRRLDVNQVVKYLYGIVVPALLYTLFLRYGYPTFHTDTLYNAPHSLLWPPTNIFFHFSVCIYFFFKTVEPATIQKALLCKDTTQASRVFKIASGICTLLHLIACLAIFFMTQSSPNSNLGILLIETINSYKIPGLKALTILSFAYVIIASSFWWINTGTMTMINDILLPRNQSARSSWSLLVALCIMGGAVAIASFSTNFLELFLSAGTFYMSVAAVPFIFAIMGFRSGNKGVAMSMLFGAATVVVWIANDLKWITGVDSLVPSMCVCTVYFFLAHYMLGEPGGWSDTH